MDIISDSGINNTVSADFNHIPSMVSYGTAFHWWYSEPTSLHTHNFCEFFLITEGSAVHEINSETVKLEKYSLVYIKNGDCHRITPDKGTGCTHMNISFLPEKLEQAADFLGFDINLLPGKTVLTSSQAEFFIKNAGIINANINKDNDIFRITVNELIAEAAAILYKSKNRVASGVPLWFQNITEKLHSPGYYSCSASDVYKLMNFSPPAAVKCFRKYTGKTVTGYLRQIKTACACEMLENTNMPIIELSNMLGYSSLSHFCRIFKNATGLTPADYRKNKNKE